MVKEVLIKETAKMRVESLLTDIELDFCSKERKREDGVVTSKSCFWEHSRRGSRQQVT